MKAYVIITGIIFALIVVAHIARMLVESTDFARDPFYLAITALAAALSVWAMMLVVRPTPRG